MSEYLITQTRVPTRPSFTPAKHGLLQRCTATQECDDCRKKREGLLQRAAVDSSPVSEVPSIVHAVLRSPGQPLDVATRVFMEPRFGHDFSDVRVHTDAKAAESARAVNALAYTVGRDVVFGTSQYTPETISGQRLVAHELAHVVQQDHARTVSLGNVILDSPDEHHFEREANQLSHQIVRDGKAVQRLSKQRSGLQRQAASSAQTQPAIRSRSQAQPTQQSLPQVQALSRILDMQVNGINRFDAELDRRAALDRRSKGPCRLTLTVRVKFSFKDTQSPSRWTTAKQNYWQNEFIRVVRDRWSFRYLLEQSQPCSSEPCTLALAILNIQPETSKQHNTIYVYYEKPSVARSSVSSNTSTLYRPDIERLGSDLRTNQTTATHETGHLLGLPHVNCGLNDPNPNRRECYGTNREESADVMGRGEIVTERDYVPFVNAIQRITGCSWRVRDGGRGPLFGNASSLLGITLGIFGGIAGGILGAALGPAGMVAGIVGGAALGGLLGFGIGKLFD